MHELAHVKRNDYLVNLKAELGMRSATVRTLRNNLAALEAAGIITQQYALAGLNYHPETHIFPYKPLFDGDVTDVGRAVESDAGYFLGLQDVMSVSRSHFDICVTIHDNNLSIEDHSTHGTKVYIAGPGK